MRRQIQLWGTRSLTVVLLVIATQRWGMPLYKQYFTPKKTVVFVPTAKVASGTFVVSFHEMGTLQAENSVMVNSEINGKIIQIVPEGTFVKPGDKLVEMDTTDLIKDARNQELAYQNALADVDQAKSELAILIEGDDTDKAKAKAQYEFDRNELERAKKNLEKQTSLAKDNLVPGSTVEQAEFDVSSKKLALDKSGMDITLKESECKRRETQKRTQVKNVQFRAQMAKITWDDALGRTKKAIINAPAAGMVVITKEWMGDGRRAFKEGDLVNPRQCVIQLPDLSSMQAKVNVGEADAPKVRLNMPVLVKLEAVPNKVFHGVVKDIASLATEPSPWESGATPGRKNFEVVIAVKESDPKILKPGMTADIEFICDEVKDALSVPIECVIEREGKTYVFVKHGKSFERTQVRVGKHNDNFVIINKGLEKRCKVALRDPTRALDEQEAGVSTPGKEEKTRKNKSAPMPGAEKG
ncbi:MAG: efflux RND transporter periplasmic adaptor subunit [Armatimonadetes bacterium]|nr:efflux RND transporter periplasmic adaptor subunit [Armatimonadota bacterium]